MENIQKNENYNQVCVWPGTLLPEDQVNDFIQFFGDEGFRVQFLESIKTFPDRDDQGSMIEGTGGRSDILFAIHDEDIGKFAIPRLQFGIRWIEDVLDNESNNSDHSVYPERIRGYRTW